MKKNSATKADKDELRPEYPAEFFQNMKPNRFAGRTSMEKQTTVVLDDDISEVFQTSEAVNTVLRSAIKAMRSAGAKVSRHPKTQKRRAS